MAGGRAGAYGLMGHSGEYVNEGRDLRGKSQLRAKQVGLYVAGTRSRNRSVVATEVRCDPDKRKKFSGGRKFIAVPIGVLGDGTGYCGTSKRAGAGLIVSYRRPKIGVADEQLEPLLRTGWAAENKSHNGRKGEPAKNLHHCHFIRVSLPEHGAVCRRDACLDSGVALFTSYA